MSRNKHVSRKIRLGRLTKGNRMVPTWVMQKTARKFKRMPKQRSWRRTKLKA